MAYPGGCHCGRVRYGVNIDTLQFKKVNGKDF